MKYAPRLHHAIPRHRGTSLVELMISMAIGLLIVAGLLAIYLNTSRTNAEMAKTYGQIENGRFAIQFLENDIVHAGYWGGFVPQFDNLTISTSPTDVPGAIPDPCLTYNTTNWNAAYLNTLIGIPVQSYDTVSDCSGVITNKRADTDILVVRHAETCVPGVGNCEADAAGKLYFLAGKCGTQTYELNTSGFSMQKRDCATAADKRKFVSNIYYIRDYAVTAGDGIPTLMRSTFDLSGGTLAHQAADALVEGIEAMRVEFGVDSLSETGAAVNYGVAINWQDTAKTIATNRGDGTADGAFVRCTTAVPCTAAQLTNSVAVKIYLLARSRERTPGHVDSKTYNMGLANTAYDPCTGLTGANLTTCRSYKRHLFTTTVRLTNISGRRETP